jgi:hypothetical protein
MFAQMYKKNCSNTRRLYPSSGDLVDETNYTEQSPS